MVIGDVPVEKGRGSRRSGSGMWSSATRTPIAPPGAPVDSTATTAPPEGPPPEKAHDLRKKGIKARITSYF
jgi:hypothetical protein